VGHAWIPPGNGAASGGRIGLVNGDIQSEKQVGGRIRCKLLIAYPEFPLHVIDVFIAVLDIQDP